MSKQVGLDMILYRNTGTQGSPVWVEMSNVRDLTGPDSFTEADVSVRGSGIKLTEPALRDMSFDWQMIYDPEDSDFDALNTAYSDKALIEFAFADGLIAEVGTRYFRVQCKIFKFDRGEPLEGATTRDVTAKPCWASIFSFVEVEA